MAYIGNNIQNQNYVPAIDYFNGDGSTVAFTLSRPVASVAAVQAVISNVPQNPGSAFTVSGSTITFTSAPPSGTSNIYVYYTSPNTQVVQPGQGTVGTTQLAGGTVNTSADATINGLTVGRGGGNSNTNVAVGYQAFPVNSSSTYSTAVGYQAGYSNISGAEITAVGNTALYANTSGGYNCAFGGAALQQNTTGTNNVAVGWQSLRLNSTASNNTAVGYQALYSNTTGTRNNAVGYKAGYSISTGNDITAFGDQAGWSTTGNLNTAIGSASLFYNSTGVENTSVGAGAMFGSSGASTGSNNTAVGRQALGNLTSANNNVAIGYQAGASLTTSYQNTFVGYQAGYSASTGGQLNVAVGCTAGSNITTGNGIICIGQCQPSSGSSTWEIVIGTNGQTGKGGNSGFISPNGGGVYQGNNSGSWSTTSDRRLKKNIVDNNDGLEKITAIQVRNFEYRLPEEVDPELKETDAVNIPGVQLGVIAQELQEVCPDCVKQETTGVLSVDPDNLTWYLVNAVKQLKAELDATKAEVAALKGAA